MISAFAVCFTGPLTAKYNRGDLEGSHQEGQFQWRKKGTKSGKPELVKLETFQDQREFCKAEGLVNPKDVGNWEVGSDGKSLQTRGIAGQWV